MCGIAGIINFDFDNLVSREILTDMTRILSHRGPDNEGIWCDRSCGLGFRRLSIIDLSDKGNQPMVNETGDVRLICNGEIYNYQSLRKDLIASGHTFSSQADSEVALHAYEEHSENFLKYLNGMFALAILDQRKNMLLLARDRLGIKPLYYKLDRKGIRFGSELKAILADPSVERDIDVMALNLYFIREVVPAPYSIYKGIRKLRPGEYLLADLNRGVQGIHLKKFWTVTFNPDHKITEKSWKEQLLCLLEDSVRMHMIGDVPVGAFLSGGVDSSSVVSLMSRVSPTPVDTFTIGFNDKSIDESPIAQMVANHCRTNHHQMTVDLDSLKILKKLVWHYDEPFGDSSAIPTYIVSEMARKYVKVVLSGDGGDELFGGYFSPETVKKINWSCRIPDKLYFIAPFFSRFFSSDHAPAVRKLALPKWLRLASLHAHIFDEDRHNVLRPDFKLSWEGVLSSYDYLREELMELDPMNACLAVYFSTYLPDDILTKVDRASSAHSLETRLPLLDYRLVELAAKIPPELKFRGKDQKYIFRKTISPFLPETVVYGHPKHGFSVPVETWGKTIWKDRLKKIRREFPCVEEMIDFSRMEQWGGSLMWQVLFFADWLTINK